MASNPIDSNFCCRPLHYIISNNGPIFAGLVNQDSGWLAWVEAWQQYAIIFWVPNMPLYSDWSSELPNLPVPFLCQLCGHRLIKSSWTKVPEVPRLEQYWVGCKSSAKKYAQYFADHLYLLQEGVSLWVLSKTRQYRMPCVSFDLPVLLLTIFEEWDLIAY